MRRIVDTIDLNTELKQKKKKKKKKSVKFNCTRFERKRKKSIASWREESIRPR